jgi:hypothetical protein
VTRRYTRGSDGERIRRLSKPDPKTGCWLWTAALNNLGYGVIRLRGRTHYAHRVSYEAFRGPLEGLNALHRCDTPRCVNHHLFRGTKKENSEDMVRKGRARGWPKGVPQGPHKRLLRELTARA